jgi:hypothetical protein
MLKKLAAHLDRFKIPYAAVHGNHDSEVKVCRNHIIDLWQAGKYSLFRKGPSTIHGVGNYIINIENEKGTIYSLILMDSGASRIYEDGKRGYDFIYPSQIAWYEWAVKSQPDVKSMVFFHIPLIEFEQVQYNLIEGRYDEPVQAAPVNTGLFAKMVELKSTTHVVAGHEHINYGLGVLDGINLIYGVKTGTCSYSCPTMQGGTLYTINTCGIVTTRFICD